MCCAAPLAVHEAEIGRMDAAIREHRQKHG